VKISLSIHEDFIANYIPLSLSLLTAPPHPPTTNIHHPSRYNPPPPTHLSFFYSLSCSFWFLFPSIPFSFQFFLPGHFSVLSVFSLLFIRTILTAFHLSFSLFLPVI
jgi:hypothetical protein